MKVEIIYEPPFAGGIGYPPLLVRVERKYFTLEFYSRKDIEAWRSLWKLHDLKLIQIVKRKGAGGLKLWKRHAYQNHLSASAFVAHICSQVHAFCPFCGADGRSIILTYSGKRKNCAGMEVIVYPCPYCRAAWEIPAADESNKEG